MRHAHSRCTVYYRRSTVSDVVSVALSFGVFDMMKYSLHFGAGISDQSIMYTVNQPMGSSLEPLRVLSELVIRM